MKVITMIHGFKTLVDDEDYEKVKHFTWSKGKVGYAVRGIKNNKKLYLHRYILNAPKGKVVDHTNHNKLDNRKNNLKICSQAENTRNVIIRSDNTSGIIGISWLEWLQKWRAYINRNGKQIHLGVFTNKELAIKARKDAEIIYA